eukprot:6192201-Pleurochrysis_carterae.AAC.2
MVGRPGLDIHSQPICRRPCLRRSASSDVGCDGNNQALMRSMLMQIVVSETTKLLGEATNGFLPWLAQWQA